jgi:hypothetical protein
MENGKSLQISNIHQFLTWCNAPALRHYPTIPRLGVPKGGGRGGGRRTTRKCIEIFISNKKERKRKEVGKKKKTTLSLCLHPKVAVHTYFHTSDDTRER